MSFKVVCKKCLSVLREVDALVISSPDGQDIKEVFVDTCPKCDVRMKVFCSSCKTGLDVTVKKQGNIPGRFNLFVDLCNTCQVNLLNNAQNSALKSDWKTWIEIFKDGFDAGFEKGQNY